MFGLWPARNAKRNAARSEYSRTAAVISFNHDGLEICRVKRSSRSRWLPVWHFVFFVYLILLIRTVAVADIGAAGYANRMEQMRNGNLLERAAAGIMDIDPITRIAAAEFRGFVSFISGG